MAPFELNFKEAKPLLNLRLDLRIRPFTLVTQSFMLSVQKCIGGPLVSSWQERQHNGISHLQ